MGELGEIDMVRGNRGCRASRFVVLGWIGERVLDGSWKQDWFNNQNFKYNSYFFFKMVREIKNLRGNIM